MQDSVKLNKKIDQNQLEINEKLDKISVELSVKIQKLGEKIIVEMGNVDIKFKYRDQGMDTQMGEKIEKLIMREDRCNNLGAVTRRSFKSRRKL